MVKTLFNVSVIYGAALDKFSDEDIVEDRLFDDSKYKICFYSACLNVIHKLNICVYTRLTFKHH